MRNLCFMALGVAFLATGCTPGTAESFSPGPPPPSAATVDVSDQRDTDAARCGPDAVGRVVSSSVTRIVTEARLVRLAEDGHTSVEPVAGLPGPFLPSVLPPSPGLDLQALIPRLPSELGYKAEPSPRLDPSAWLEEIEGLNGPLDFVVFAGVDRVEAKADVSCGPADVRHLTLSTWTVPAEGIRECGRAVPPTSTAALTEQFCP